MTTVAQQPSQPDRGIKVPVWQRIDLRFLAFVAELERSGRFWLAAAMVAVTAEAVSFLFAASWYPGYADRFTLLAANPFQISDLGLPWPEHRLRMLGPVIAWALGLQGLAGTLVPVAANIPLLMITYRAVSTRTSLVAGVLFTLLLATTHVTMTSRTLLGYHDSLVFLCLLLTMLSRRLWVACPLFFLALFGDPRAAFSIPLVLMWVLDQRPSGHPFRQFTGYAVAFAGTFAAWLLVAFALTRIFDNDAATVSRLSIYLTGEFISLINPGYLQLVSFMTFKAGWLLPLALCWLWLGTHPWRVASIVASLLAIGLISLLIHDYSRALAFCFPILFVAACALYRAAPRVTPWVLGTTLLVNLMTPFYQGMTSGLWLASYPLPVELVRAIWGS